MGNLGSFNTHRGANYIRTGTNMLKAAADHVKEGAGAAPAQVSWVLTALCTQQPGPSFQLAHLETEPTAPPCLF